jgi:hypothetical protein
MNLYRKTIYQILFIASIFFVVSCEKGANEIEYGFPLVYMPQSTIFSGGLNNDYPVPGPNPVKNYSVDSINKKVNITMGVYRAGTQKLEPFTVEVYANKDTLNSLIANSVYVNSAPLPEDVYSFPATVSVENGRESTFNLILDKGKLNSNYVGLKGKTLVVAIGIKNPSNYELNKALSTTIVLIDSTITF